MQICCPFFLVQIRKLGSFGGSLPQPASEKGFDVDV
jgi:hypothetical protein